MTFPHATSAVDATVTRAQPPVQRISAKLTAAVIAIAAAAIALPLAMLAYGPVIEEPAELREIKRPKPVIPAQIVPEVEPLRLADLSNTDARAYNASIPFSTAPNPAARPFILQSSTMDYARAVDCLAAATWYEAGDDDIGQRAVAQVVINRMRHPAFPKTICGVVFQGQERRTGCQFTFTCDGAMARRPSPAAWTRAQTIARQALSGSVFAKVGHSTHYHTDWVVPYWSSSLDKVAEVHTHLFFRWTGWWGTPGAFRGGHSGSEPVIAKMAPLSSAHGGDPTLDLAADPTTLLTPESIPDAAVPKPILASGDSFHVALNKGMGADNFAALAIRTCGERSYCKFLGWTDASKVPPAGTDPNPTQLEAMSFSYLRDQGQGFSKALWNCAEFKRPSAMQCMRRTPVAAATPAPHPNIIGSSEVAPNATLAGGRSGTLSGVRRKGDAGAQVPAQAPPPSQPPAAPQPPAAE